MVRKIFSDKEFNFNTCKTVLLGIWGHPDGVAISDVGRNKMLIIFKDVRKGIQIRNGGLWSIRENLLNLQIWNGRESVYEVDHKYMELWDSYCLNCGILGHVKKECRNSMAMASWNHMKPKYGLGLGVNRARVILARGTEQDSKEINREWTDANQDCEGVRVRMECMKKHLAEESGTGRGLEAGLQRNLKANTEQQTGLGRESYGSRQHVEEVSENLLFKHMFSDGKSLRRGDKSATVKTDVRKGKGKLQEIGQSFKEGRQEHLEVGENMKYQPFGIKTGLHEVHFDEPKQMEDCFERQQVEEGAWENPKKLTIREGLEMLFGKKEAQINQHGNTAINKHSEKETGIVKHGASQLWSNREKSKMKRIITTAGRTMIQCMVNGEKYYVELAEEKQDMEEELAATSEQRNDNQPQISTANDKDWEGMFVYGHPDHKRRKELWKELTYANNNLDVPTTFIGDFNDVIAQHEKVGLHPKSTSHIEAFRCFVDKNALMDLELQGSKYTWFSNPRNGFVTKERIDRVLTIWEWRRAFQHATLSALPAISSDHTPLVLNVKPRGIRSGYFKFEAFWADHVDCGNVIRRGWNSVCNSTVDHWTTLTRRMNNCKQDLIKWSKVNFKRTDIEIQKLMHNLKQAEERRGASWIWKSIVHGKNFLLRNGRWSIGNGEKVRILEDNWILNMQKSPQIMNNEVTFVKELITEGQGWNINELQKHFDGVTIGKIIRTPVSVIGREDKFSWPFKTDGKNQSPLSMRCCFALGQGLRGLELKFSVVLWLIQSHLLKNG
ncbi:hypothetical protein Ahy_B02g058211 [Arachis hypogaea]|uniref:CCHC-type domain-containing protein n=1 Tax=Arachis hypogaea TaxID=3818 RepID=A0A445AE57_ARAHY|nr:hypothetical protein Ahy_B02g058211 [Arachis hypogaea]